MTRKIAFDYEQALDKATALFWAHGYAETGLRDLLKVMGIREGSFYNTLKSKKNLYLTCLQRYEVQVTMPRIEALLQADTASAGIRAFFSAVLDGLDNPATPSRLCMIAAMEAEEVLAEPEFAQYAQQSLSQLKGHFAQRLHADQAQGFIPSELDTETVADVLITYLQGLWRMALLSYDRSTYQRRTDVLLKQLGL
ncbi:TetR/AcrR family transcriptional regulator [Pseudomonas sp. NPDC087029]|uniref:TetR/AcrR family transcriptional regulator n=1 Tax=Pseudomonas sp. NPDC087029 TaxID=3364433 RepID=UPI0037F6404C